LKEILNEKDDAPAEKDSNETKSETDTTAPEDKLPGKTGE
jgi:hypothetical protein